MEFEKKNDVSRSESDSLGGHGARNGGVQGGPVKLVAALLDRHLLVGVGYGTGCDRVLGLQAEPGHEQDADDASR